jgi:coenzyme F420-reducing hydrogenase delta subunit
MIDANEHELAAMMQASDRAGEFIESVGATDMAAWSREQWGQFIEVICTGYVEKLIDLRAGITTAMDKVSIG